ncbi:hypothetical protein ACOMHN_012865 [Nucella lapillus]
MTSNSKPSRVLLRSYRKSGVVGVSWHKNAALLSFPQCIRRLHYKKDFSILGVLISSVNNSRLVLVFQLKVQEFSKNSRVRKPNMNAFDFLFCALLIVLIHGHTEATRGRRMRQRVHEIRQMSSVIRNINGQAAANRSRNWRPRTRLSAAFSNAIRSVNPQGQVDAEQGNGNLGHQAPEGQLPHVASAAVHNVSGGQGHVSANISQNRPQAHEIQPVIANAINDANLPGQASSGNRSENWRQRAHDIHQMGANQHHNESGGQLPEEGGVEADLQSWQDLMVMNDVHNISDFIRLLTRDGEPVREEDIIVRSENDDGKIVIAGSDDILAPSDECSPRNTTVRLRLMDQDPNVVIYPECTRVERCGGCTPTPYLACEPLYKEMVVLQVLKARYSYPGAISMNMEGVAPVQVERHLTCRATCTLTQEDCGGNSRFVPHLCRCQCQSYKHCNSRQEWNNVKCKCECPDEVSCCSHDKAGVQNRRCPMFFDHNFCECTLKENIGANPNASQAEIEAWLASRQNRQPSDFHLTNGLPEAPTTPTIPPTATTPTTTPPPTTTGRASCAHLSCPRNMIRAMTASGRCLCQSPRRPRRG